MTEKTEKLFREAEAVEDFMRKHEIGCCLKNMIRHYKTGEYPTTLQEIKSQLKDDKAHIRECRSGSVNREFDDVLRGL